MNKIFFVFVYLILKSVLLFGQLPHSGRGLYVDKFFRSTNSPSGSLIVDQNLSVLSVTQKENDLLQYAKDNHFTYLILYDLHRVLGNPLFESYLCNFIQKARTEYCIEYFGAASSCASIYNSVVEGGSEPMDLSGRNSSSLSYSPELDSLFQLLSEDYQPGDSMFYFSEAIKLNLRAAEFNTACNYKIDVLVTEYEFWNSGADNCTGDAATRDQKYERFQTMITSMDAIRDNYNNQITGHSIFVEAYLGFLNQNTIYQHQSIADWLDGSYNGKRRVDRFSLHYYASDPAKMYSRTSSGWNFQGYYNTRFLDFCQPGTNEKTNILPLMSAENTAWGAGNNFLGSWFNKNVANNIFTAEKFWYNDWYDDAVNYSPNLVGHTQHGNAVSPGAVLWFTSSQLNGHVNNPVLFTSNSPVCVPSGQNGNLSFNYQGPAERGSTFKFYITDAGSSVVRCGSTASFPWPAYDPVSQSSINLNAALGSCSLPVGEYDAHLELRFASACSACVFPCSVYTAPPQRVSVVNSGRIIALTPTVTCMGNPVYLKASQASNGSGNYQWYDGSSPISGATSADFAPPAVAGMKNYSCKITGSPGSCSANLTNAIPVTINAYPSASITSINLNGCSITLRPNPAGAAYKWHDGSTSSTYTTSFGGLCSVTATVNGCSSTATYNYQKAVLDLVSKTNTCQGTSGGSLSLRMYAGASPYVLNWSGPVSGSMNGLYPGIHTIQNLPAGSYSVSITDANSCTVILNVPPQIETFSNISVVNATNPATCTWSSDGEAEILSVSGGAGPPYSFRWHLNNSTSSQQSGLSPGSYLIDIRDSALCLTVHSLNVGVANATLTPSVSISASPGDSLCQGETVVLTASPVNGGVNPLYDWRLNNQSIASGVDNISMNNLNDGDQISCVMTSSFPCPSINPVSSSFIPFTVTTPQTWYADADGDGFGDAGSALLSCEAPAGFVLSNTDCNDSNPQVYPGAFEACNGIDDNCNGTIDESTCVARLFLSLWIQGFYEGGSLSAVLYENNLSANADDCDTVCLSLFDLATSIEFQMKCGIIKTNGLLTLDFDSVSLGKAYYLKIIHRNSLETWSSVPVLFSAESYYSLKHSSGSAFGNNLAEVMPGIWAIYSGDISGLIAGEQDGRIDQYDIDFFESVMLNQSSGYLISDLTGDGLAESADFSLLEKNAVLNIIISRP
ncbi:MAG: hypothetical protein DWQ39_10235 [Bacteroidetes bacterium]|nr:MAG: hypothetical protein DWQ33_02940 [Bacteroidota bacterium]REK00941.1 MAG: hypothetical protein DWQ39_10235 [Bacteroidota bacterium]